MANPPPGSGVQRASPVDADKLWRDRISQELQFQRAWVEEYGFMVNDDKRTTLRKGLSNSDASKEMSVGEKTLAELKSEMSYSGMKSTSHASYRVRPSPELFNDKEFNRRKFRTA